MLLRSAGTLLLKCSRVTGNWETGIRPASAEQATDIPTVVSAAKRQIQPLVVWEYVPEVCSLGWMRGLAQPLAILGVLQKGTLRSRRMRLQQAIQPVHENYLVTLCERLFFALGFTGGDAIGVSTVSIGFWASA
jgi:hypothetical protein